MKMLYKVTWYFKGIKKAFGQRVNFWNFIKFCAVRFFPEKSVYLLGIMFPTVDLILWKQIFQLFFKEEYSPTGYEIKKGDVIIDIGANRGVFVVLAAHLGAGEILAFEPDLENFAALSEIVKINDLEQVKLFNMAVAASSGQVRIYQANTNTRHTLTGVDVVTGQKIENYQEVASITLNDVMKNLQKVDLLKIDCEGAEYEIIFNTRVQILKKIQKIVLEYHGDSNSSDVKKLLARLEEASFNVHFEANRFGRPYGMIYASSLPVKEYSHVG